MTWSCRLSPTLCLLAILLCAIPASWSDKADLKVEYHKLPEFCFKKYDKATSDFELHDDLKCENDMPASLKGKEKETCAKLFTHQATTKDIDSLALNPNYQQETLWCAEYNMLCCLRSQYACLDTPLRGNAAYCDELRTNPEKCDTDFKDKAKHCKQSCGKCDVDLDSCEDKHLGCEYMKGMCSEEDQKLKMERLCPRTCDKQNSTTSACEKIKELRKFRKEKINKKEGCKNSGKGCSQNIMLCEDEYYIDRMAKSCQETCGRCVKTNFACEDKIGSTCDTWKKNGFCDVDGTYPKGVILQHCPKSCDYC